jgi:hypothetical protein
VSDVERFPHTIKGEIGKMPIIPVRFLGDDNKAIEELALLDTGAAVSVLPYKMGLALKQDWNNPKLYEARLGGVFRNLTGKFVKASLQIGSLEPREVAFMWMESEDVPLILGNGNFFQVFDVCFSRLNNEISVRIARASAAG